MFRALRHRGDRGILALALLARRPARSCPDARLREECMMALRAGLHLPVIDGDRCVHGMAASASCSRCVAACPHGALQLTPDSLTFNESACTGCGHCRPACTEAAIAFPDLSLSPVIDTEASEALLACSIAAPEQDPGSIPCLHMFGERDVARLADDGIAVLRTARGRCETCINRAVTGIEDHANAVNRLRTSRGRKSLVVADEAPPDWVRQVSATLTQGRKLDQSRRTLFAGLLRRSRPAMSGQTAAAGPALACSAPMIDQAACSGCDACARICPHEAIALSHDADGLHYATQPEACTGCGLCTDLCQDGAVHVVAFASVSSQRVALLQDRCTRCGTLFHEPVRAGAGDEKRCRICRGHTHPSKLFEVRT
jgi:NAD-dependent dihydropyrimidine dehydrogenase PreA subunit